MKQLSVPVLPIGVWFVVALASPTTTEAQEQSPQPLSSRIEVREFTRDVGVLPYGVAPQEVHVSPDGDRYAFAAQLGAKVVAVVDGVQGRKYDWIVENRIGFTADSRHFFYVVRKRDKRVFVFEENEGKEYEAIEEPVASRTGSRVGYVAGRGGKYFTVIDGVEGRAYDALTLVALTERGKSTCVATMGMEQCVVIDGVEGNRYEQVADVRMSDDGQLVVYRARRADQWLMVVNGEEQRPFDEIGAATLTRVGSHYAYVARSGNASFLVHDGEEKKLTTRSFPAHVTLSPDGKRVAYAAVTPGANGVSVIVNDRPHGRFEQVLGIRFSPDGERILVIARRGGKSVLVADGVKLLDADMIHPQSIGLSDDGRYVACVARTGQEDTVYVNGVRGPSFGQVLNTGPLVFQGDRMMFPVVGANFRDGVSRLGTPERTTNLVHADVSVVVGR